MRGRGLGLATGVFALGRFACGVEDRGDLAAGGGEFGLGTGFTLNRRVDDRAPLLLVGRAGLAIEPCELFRQGRARLGVFGIGRDVARSAFLLNFSLYQGPLGHQAQDLPQDSALAREDLGLGRFSGRRAGAGFWCVWGA